MSTSLHSPDPECLVATAAEVAKLLGISERHLWACHADGRLGPRPLAFGRAKRWRVAEIHAWVAAGAPARDRWDAIQAETPAAPAKRLITTEADRG